MAHRPARPTSILHCKPALNLLSFNHHEVITREDQVQIYEEPVSDPDGEITTTFFALNQNVKENRLLPKGWRTDGPSADKTGLKHQTGD